MTKARIFVFLAALGCVTTFAQTPALTPAPTPALDLRINQLIDQLSQAKTIEEAAISPDGQWITWNVGGDEGSEVEVAPMSNPSAALRLTACAAGTKGHENVAVFSPDSRQIAFFSDCTANHNTGIFLAETTGARAPRRLTELNGNGLGLEWSSDGQRLSFLYVEGATRQPSALAAEKAPAGVIGVDGLEISRVATVDTANGKLSQITPAKLYVYEYNWSPDSTKLVYVAAPPPGEDNWWIAKLYTQVGQEEPAPILDTQTISGPLHGLQIAVPRWSPDGQRIAFIGGLMSDQGTSGGDIYMMPAGGGEPVDVTPNRTGSPAWFDWLDNDNLFISEVKSGASHLFVYNPQTHEESSKYNLMLPETVGAGGLYMRISVSKKNAIALISSSFERPYEVWAGDLMDLKQITHVNDAVKPPWGKGLSVKWKNDGFHMQGWLLLPAHYDPAKKYPMVVSVHGGPSWENMPYWPEVDYEPATFSALDYFVLLPNPRGSQGQGEKFTEANREDFGYGDLRDILAGVDAVEKKYSVDDSRVGITGWSYGGFMTMFAVTQTHRFRAAVAGAGISNLQSYYGQNSIDQWLIPFFGKSVYDAPAVYARSSAINYIKNVKTPTLVVVGDRDGECPAPQSFEFWHALRDLKVPTQLVVYPDEGHEFENLEHRRDVLERALRWFNEYMPASN